MAKTASNLSIGRWLEPFIVHPSIKVLLPGYEKNDDNIQHPRVDPDNIIFDSLFKTYEVDGYDYAENNLTPSENTDSPEVNPFLLLAQVVLGLPSRLGDSPRQAVRNLFGGWTSIFKEEQAEQRNQRSKGSRHVYEPVAGEGYGTEYLTPSGYGRDTVPLMGHSDRQEKKSVSTKKSKGSFNFQGKRFWNVLFIPFKLVIFAVKFVTLPLKFALNIVKLITEALPEMLLNLTGVLIGACLARGMELLGFNRDSRTSFEDPDGFDGECSENYQEGPQVGSGGLILRGALLILALLVLVPVHYAARVWQFLGAALTSPEKSARMAWSYGQAIKYRPLAYFFSILGAAISVTITAILWTITLPLVFSGAVAFFPSLGSVLTSLSQLPIVANALAYINGAAVLVSGTLPAAFSAAATAISTLFGLAVSAETLALAAVVAFIVAPVGSILSRVADVLANAWASWKSDMPAAQGIKAVADSLVPDVVKECFSPSEKSQKMAKRSKRDLEEAEGSNPDYHQGGYRSRPAGVAVENDRREDDCVPSQYDV